MDKRVETRLSLIVVGPALRSFCLLTGSGFKVEIRAACTLREFLCESLGEHDPFSRPDRRDGWRDSSRFCSSRHRLDGP